jgi:hypothetical protein
VVDEHVIGIGSRCEAEDDLGVDLALNGVVAEGVVNLGFEVAFMVGTGADQLLARRQVLREEGVGRVRDGRRSVGVGGGRDHDVGRRVGRGNDNDIQGGRREIKGIRRRGR